MYEKTVGKWSFRGPMPTGPVNNTAAAGSYARAPYMYVGTFVVSENGSERVVDIYMRYPCTTTPMTIAITSTEYNGYGLDRYPEVRQWDNTIYAAIGLFRHYMLSDENPWWPLALKYDK